ncbi:tRNA wybutosine-synthesizing protein 4 isoform X2 [Cuculus canorus]|uniref:tRNA wybutosine-synthesizing protein 4 isoform X2 n=1 Tax=Cuculus canorus TaxID=55661 RepID=UPI0023AB0584|nr:tRNA wybutosine-synthesizing protein 4 isoform X2 [Cuculus canorus]
MGRERRSAVQSTGGSSAVSKASAAARGYIQDRFLGLLAGPGRRRAPLVHRGYYIRARAVDHCIQDFLQKTQSHPRTQILSLGAGFDSLFFRLKDLGLLRRTVVYEVDFPSVARRKAALIRRTEELSALLGDIGGEGLGMASTEGFEGAVAGEGYRLLGVDLSELSHLEKALEEAGLDRGVPTVVLAEVVLTYMETSRSDALIQWAAERFSQVCFLLYEQMHPEDPFGRVMQRHFRQLNSALRSLETYPEREDQERRFLQRGWSECSVVDMNEFFTTCTAEEEQRRVQALEPFDEYEEWHLKCSHYFVLAASKGMEPPWTPLLPTLTGSPHHGPTRVVGSVPAAACASNPDSLGLRRYGHRSVLLKPDVVLTTGGFGEDDGQHCRVRTFHVLVKREGGWRAGGVRQETPDTRWGERLYHTALCLSDDVVLLVGGRTSPSSSGVATVWLKVSGTSAEWDAAEVTVEPVDLPAVAEPPSHRWRHSATQVTFQGENFLFLYGGRSATEPVLGDWCFLRIPELSYTVIPVEGAVPERRHSHGACAWEGGAVIVGGLGADEKPLGSLFLLRELQRGFGWQPMETHPPLVPRYSHTAHVHDGKLLLVGGVWLRSSSVPGVTVVDLTTGLCLDYTIDVEPLEWPLMLHNHSSVLLPDEKELLVLGGGGNCFSFGTHLNSEPVLLDLNSILTTP